MDYQEYPVPERLAGWVKSRWMLTCEQDQHDWIERDATPDGCIEIIWRSRGQSIWKTAQPDHFIGGLIEQPARLRMSGDAVFTGIRLWPWAWNLLGGRPVKSFIDGWIPAEKGGTVDEVLDSLTHLVDHAHSGLSGTSITQSRSVRDLCQRTGRSHRWLQRWFERNVGVPPRRYFKMLRFQEALKNIQQDDAHLAQHAADAGFSDQAHMARDFRSMAGTTSRNARKNATGPFL